MKTIMAFGDSLTWGTDALNDCRHAFWDRWPNVLQAALGDRYHVVAEGLGGRTTVFDDPDPSVDRNGAHALPILLGSHSPLDLVIIMLGANDLKPHICGVAEESAQGMRRLVSIIRAYPYRRNAPPPQILIVSPPHFREKQDGSGPEAGRDINESRKLAALYRDVAESENVSFLDAAPAIKASDVDGVHLDAENTREIGKILSPFVQKLLQRP